MSRAKRFKRAYKPFWAFSSLKESFVRTLLEAWGFRVRPLGIGVESRREVKETGSGPDFAVYLGDELLCFIEVTGPNWHYAPGQPVWVTYDKFRKLHAWHLKAPVIFVFLGFNDNRLVAALYADYETLYPYAEDPRYIVKAAPYGIEETYIQTPYTAWKPLRKLVRELLPLVRA